MNRHPPFAIRKRMLFWVAHMVDAYIDGEALELLWWQSSIGPGGLNEKIGAAVDNEHKCGACNYWAHAKKRNCSNPETPVYYADCLYPVDDLPLPHCVNFEPTNSENGAKCPCFVPLDTSA